MAKKEYWTTCAIEVPGGRRLRAGEQLDDADLELLQQPVEGEANGESHLQNLIDGGAIQNEPLTEPDAALPADATPEQAGVVVQAGDDAEVGEARG